MTTPSPAPREPERLLSEDLTETADDFIGCVGDIDGDIAAQRMRDYATRARALESQLAAARAGETADAHHTKDELYEHRHHLFALATRGLPCWRSRLHADGTGYEGWFLVCATLPTDATISYHQPDRLWSLFDHAETLERGRAWDGHTSADVLTRIAALAPSPESRALGLLRRVEDLGLEHAPMCGFLRDVVRPCSCGRDDLDREIAEAVK